MKNYTLKNSCRICGGTNLVEVLDLGHMPPANAFVPHATIAMSLQEFPLRTYFCATCSLVQLLDVVDPSILFRHYEYLTSASKPLVEHFTNAGKMLTDKFVASKKDLVVEIGGSDAVLLGAIADRCKVLNIEPARNVAELSTKKGVETISEFFTLDLAKEIKEKYGSAQLIIANNVMAHTDPLRGVFEGVKALLAPKGVFVFENHWVENLIGDGGFDQIYHEHLCYFSLTALKHLVESVGLSIFDVEVIPNHGQSLRVYVGAGRVPSKTVEELLLREKELGLHTVDRFLKFREKVEKNRNELRTLIAKIRTDGKTIVGYGAPAKGNTLINFCGLTSRDIDFITDTTPLKQNTYAPGSGIPVFHPDILEKKRPDYLLLLAWNFADVIIKKETAFRNSGGKFIIPVPTPRIV